MVPIQVRTLTPFTFRRSKSHKRHAQHKRRTSPRGRFERLESRMVLSTTWAITPSTLPQDTVGVPYDLVINTTDTNSVTLAVSSLKKAVPGITVPSSGTNSLLINGTPTAAGTETFTVTATDTATGKTATVKYSLIVNPAVSLAPATLPGDTVNVAYSQAITASGGTGTITLTVSNLENPESLPLTVASSGTNSLLISGTPTTTGTETFTVTAADSLGVTASTNYSITVNPVVSLTPTTLPTDPVYVLPYSQTITAVGGTNPTLTVSNIQNPIPGITVPSNGTGSITISGTPTAPGTETFTVTAIDSAGGPSATANYSITANAVNPSGIVLTSVTGDCDDGAASFIDPTSQNIVVAGSSFCPPTSPYSYKMSVARYLSNGSLDTSFNGTGFTITDGPKAGANYGSCAADYPSSSGDKIVVGGSFWPTAGSIWTEFAVTRYNAGGSLDTTFGTTGEVVTNIGNGQSSANAVLVLPNGDILAAGSADNNSDFALACYTPAGVLDTSFKPGAGDPVAFTTPKGIVTTTLGGEIQTVSSLAIQTVGTQTYILAAGDDCAANGAEYGVLVRYNLNGSLDTTFGTNGVVLQPNISGFASLVVDSSTGNIYAGGAGSNGMAIVEYSPSGALDTAFTNNVATDNIAGNACSMAIQPQPNGTIEIIASGAVPPAGTGYNPGYSAAAVRFNSDGTLDTSFGALGYAVAPSSAPVQLELGAVDIESNGGFVLTGVATVPTRQYFAVAQFSPNGILNTSFGNPNLQAQSDVSSAGSSGTAMAVALPAMEEANLATSAGAADNTVGQSVSIQTLPVVDVPQAVPVAGTWSRSVTHSPMGPRTVGESIARKALVGHADASHGLAAWTVDRVLADAGPWDL